VSGGEIRFGDGWLNTMYRQKDNPLPLLKKRKEKYEMDNVKEYIRKRNLILELLAQEVRLFINQSVFRKLLQIEYNIIIYSGRCFDGLAQST